MGGRQVQLSSLIPAVLALVPAGCQCSPAVRQLRRQAAAAGARLYLVAAGADLPSVRRLAARAGQPAAKVLADPRAVLATAYRPRGLTAVLAHADGSVSQVLRRLGPATRLAGQLRSLAPAAP